MLNVAIQKQLYNVSVVLPPHITFPKEPGRRLLRAAATMRPSPLGKRSIVRARPRLRRGDPPHVPAVPAPAGPREPSHAVAGGQLRRLCGHPRHGCRRVRARSVPRRHCLPPSPARKSTGPPSSTKRSSAEPTACSSSVPCRRASSAVRRPQRATSVCRALLGVGGPSVAAPEPGRRDRNQRQDDGDLADPLDLRDSRAVGPACSARSNITTASTRLRPT